MSEVFLSYSHKDNVSCDPEHKERKWVTHFHEDLERNLRAICKPHEFSNVFIDYRDREGRLDLDDMVQQKLDRSTILISILTGNYERPEGYAKHEREYFLISRLYASNYNFLIEKVPYEEKRDIILYEFYDQNDNNWDTLCRHKKNEKYYQRLKDLANDVKLCLRKTPARSDLKKVYLSFSTSKINFKYRRKIKHELQRLGYKVVPELTTVNSSVEFKENISNSLENAEFALLILGNEESLKPEHSSKSIEELQFEVAFKKDIPKTIWLPDFYDNIDSKQLKFINQFLKDDSSTFTSDEYDLYECSLQKIIYEIENKEKLLKPDQVASNANEKNVFISLTDKEQVNSEELKRAIAVLKDKGFVVEHSQFSNQPRDNRGFREACLKNASYILLWSGNVQEAEVYRSLTGDLKRSSHVKHDRKIVYGVNFDDDEFITFNNIEALLNYIK